MNINRHKEKETLKRKCPHCDKEICLPPNGDTYPYAKCPYCVGIFLI